jgi:hypothetical protein
MDAIRQRLRVRPGSGLAAEFDAFASQVVARARPKAAYGLAGIDGKRDDGVTIEGVVFESRVLRVNLDEAQRVFPFMATCGVELDAWFGPRSGEDVLKQFWLDALKEAALRDASRALLHDLNTRYVPGKTSAMNPGSLRDWPITQQRPFFQLMAEAASALGVTLNDSCLMTPNKSVTGLRFSIQEAWESCLLCPRDDCSGRRAAYDPARFEREYAHARSGLNQPEEEAH